jgi:hypothetical protein
MNLFLPQLLPIATPEQFKLHLACWDGEDQPLNVFVRDRTEWEGWNKWRGVRNDFNHDYIFSLIGFYPERDRWLFGGAYRVLSRKPIKNAASYEIELLKDSEPFIGRLKLEMKRPCRAKVVNFENHYKNLVVVELAPAPYSGEAFPGYEQIDIAFPMLETIFAIQRSDWKAALENMKGVYLITDTSTESATSARLTVTRAFGRGGPAMCRRLTVITMNSPSSLQRMAMNTRAHFRFALLEQRSMKTDDNTIIQREQYWKGVLLARGEYGYNRN